MRLQVDGLCAVAFWGISVHVIVFLAGVAFAARPAIFLGRLPTID
jgi:hypothetical protein